MLPPILQFLANSLVYFIKGNELFVVFDKGINKNGVGFYCMAIYNSEKNETVFRHVSDKHIVVPIDISPQILKSQINEILKARFYEIKENNDFLLNNENDSD